MKIRKLMSGMLAGVMTMSASMVYQLPAAAEDSQSISEAVSIAQGDETALALQSAGSNDHLSAQLEKNKSLDIILPSYGVYSADSSVTVTCTVPADLTTVDQDDTSQTKQAEAAFHVIINEDWNNPVVCAYEEGKTEYSLTLDAETLKNAAIIYISNPNNESISVETDINGYVQDTRDVYNVPAIEQNFIMTLEAPGWVPIYAQEKVNNFELSNEWKGKTIGELRKSISKFVLPAQTYISDSANAGAEAFVQNIGISTQENWIGGVGNCRFALDESGIIYMDQLLPDESHDDEIIEEIVYQICVKTAWNGDLASNVCTSDVIAGMNVGDKITVNFVQDDRKELPLPQISGSSVMITSTESYLSGCTAYADAAIDSVDGIQYGTTTVSDVLSNYKSLTIPAGSMVYSMAGDLTADMLAYNINVSLSRTVDGKEETTTVNSGSDEQLSYSSIILTDFLKGYEDWTITGIGYGVFPNVEWKDEGGVCVCPSIRNATTGQMFEIQFTENTLPKITLPSFHELMNVTGADLNTYHDNDVTGTLATAHFEYSDCELNGKTLSEFLNNYSAIEITAPGYYSDSVGAGMDAFRYRLSITAKDKDAADDENDKIEILNYQEFTLDENGRVPSVIYSVCGSRPAAEHPDYVISKVELCIETTVISEDGNGHVQSDAISGLPLNSYIHIDFSEPTGKTETINSLPVKSVKLTVNSGAEAGAPEGKISLTDSVLIGQTIGDIKKNYHAFTVAAPGYQSDDMGCTADSFEYDIVFGAEEPDTNDTAWIGWDHIALDKPHSVFMDGDSDIVSGKYDSYELKDIQLRIRARLDYTGDSASVADSKLAGLAEGTKFTVYLTEDNREILDIPSLTGDISMYVTNSPDEEALQWCDGGWACADILQNIDGVTYGKTTFGEFKKKYKSIRTAGNAYLSDSENIGADNFIYQVLIVTTDNKEAYCDDFAYTSAGVTMIDNIESELSDTDIIQKINIRVSSKMQNKSGTDKSEATSEIIRNMADGTTFTITNEDPRKECEITVTSNSVELYAYDDGDGKGVNVRGNGEIADCELVGKTLNELFDEYKWTKLNAPGYLSDSISAGKDAFAVHVCIAAAAPGAADDDWDSFVWLDWERFGLDEGGIDKFGKYEESFREDKGNYIIRNVTVEFLSAVDEDGKAISEEIRKLSVGDKVDLQLAEPTQRETYYFDPIRETSVTITAKLDDNGNICGEFEFPQDDDSPLLGMTLKELKAKYSAYAMSEAPGYFDDTVNAGKSAFAYRMSLAALAPGAKEDEWDKYQWLSWDSNPLDSTDPISFDIYGDMFEKYSDYVIVQVYNRVEFAADENGKPISSVISGLKPGQTVSVSLKKDDREIVTLPAATGDLQMYVIHGDWIDGGWSFSDEPITLDKVTCGKTTLGEFIDTYRAFNATGSVYGGDSENIGKDMFQYQFCLEMSDGTNFKSDTFDFDQSGSFLVDTMRKDSDSSYIKSGDRSLVIKNVKISFTSKTGWNSETNKSYALSEKIKAMEEGHTFTVYAYATAPAVPEDVKFESAGGTSVKLSWSESVNADEYIIYSFDATNGYCEIGRTNDTSFTVTGLKAGTEYGFCIKAINGTYSSDLSQIVYYRVPDSAVEVTKPTGVIATSGECSVSLSWNSVDGAEYYIVYSYDPASGYHEEGRPVDNKLTVTGLTGGKSYGFLIRAYGSGKLSDFSDAVYAIPYVSVNKPTGVTAKAVTGGISLKWNAISSAEYYIVYSYDNENGYREQGRPVDNSFTVTGLNYGVNYGFLIRAYGNGTLSDLSDIVFCQMAGVAKPENVKAVPGTGSVSLTWDGVDADYYIIYSYDAVNGYLEKGRPTGTEYTISGLLNGMEYGFLIRACKNGELSDFSSIVYAVPIGISAPTGVNAVPGRNSVTLTWDEVSGAEYYVIYTYDATFGFLEKGRPVSNSFTVSGLLNGQQYGFLIRACSSNSVSDFSSIVYAAPQGINAPQNVSAVPGAGSVQLDWDDVSGADYYIVYTYDSVFGYLEKGRPTSSSFTVSGLLNGQQYGFLIRACSNNSTVSDFSSIVYAIPEGASVPQNVKADAGAGSVKLDWDDVAGAEYYIVYSYDPQFGYLEKGRPTVSEMNVTGLINNMEYGFTIRAYTNGMLSDFSTMIYSTPTGLDVPAGLTATAGAGAINLKWSPVTGAEYYIVYSYDPIIGFLEKGRPTSTEFTIDGLASGAEYNYLIRAFGNGTLSDFSSIVSAKAL